MRKPEKRRDRLVRPGLQLRLILAFLAVATLALLLQFVLFAAVFSTAAAELPQDGPLFMERMTGLSLVILAVSLGVLLPLSLFVGVLVTFRVAGSLQRFEKHLEAIARGEDPGPCRIRAGDDLQDFCAKFNAALERIRGRGAFREDTTLAGSLDEAA
ncbi:MAG: hypothetical protein NTY35_10180 [Planctomycetota bacterium]|nr:hypothetical protein [Planctomycetota bacterium]